MRRLMAGIPAASALVVLALLAGCSSGPVVTELPSEKTYLDDDAMVMFNNDLKSMGQAIEYGDADTEKNLRNRIAENARTYQRALVSALYDDGSTPRRALAAILLGFTGDSAVIGPLITVVANDDEKASVRLNAVLGLSALDDKLRDYKDHKSLMAALSREMVSVESSFQMRRACVQAYSVAYEAGDSLAPLNQRFAGDPDIKVQVAAAYALGSINSKESVPSLKSMGMGHPEPEMRAATAVALGRIDYPSQCIPALADACGDESPIVRREAIDGISRHYNGDRERVYVTLVTGLSDFDSEVRESAALALARVGDTRAIEPLIQATGDRTAIVRQAAATSLGDLIKGSEHEKQAYPLVDLLGDSNPDVKISAMNSLGRITGQHFGSEPQPWRQYFYKKYRELDPVLQYEGKPKPRLTSNINSSGPRRTNTPNYNNQNRNNNNWQQNRNNTNTNRNTNWNNRPGSTQPAPRR